MRSRALLVAVLCLIVPRQSSAVVFGQVDTFQDGTTMNWRKGNPSQNQPTNVATGGPGGDGDRFLHNISNGGSGVDSRMIMFNLVQWSGDYNTARIDRVTAHMANLGTTMLHMRIALRGGANGNTTYGSSVAALLPADGVWRLFTFDLTTSALANINGGSDTLAEVLGSVVEVRILSALNGPTFLGDAIAGTLGVDNITARDIANAIVRITEIVFVEGVPRISFATLAGRSYRVERKNTLTESEWIPLSNATNVPGTGGEVQISDLEPGAGSLPARSYRAVLLPP